MVNFMFYWSPDFRLRLGMQHTSSALLILRLLESAWNKTTGSPGSARLSLRNPVNQFLLILSLWRTLTSTYM